MSAWMNGKSQPSLGKAIGIAAGNIIRGMKRHPTLEDEVVVYANATILGGDTVIGHHAVVGSSVWLTASVWWLFISMHRYGEMPAMLAGAAVLALALFLGSYTALACALAAWAWRRSAAGPVRAALIFSAAWLLAELARAQWFTGFPWAATGDAKAPKSVKIAGVGSVDDIKQAAFAALK